MNSFALVLFAALSVYAACFASSAFAASRGGCEKALTSTAPAADQLAFEFSTPAASAPVKVELRAPVSQKEVVDVLYASRTILEKSFVELDTLVAKHPDHPMIPDWVAALAKMKAIASAVEAIPEKERRYFAEIQKAALAAISKHQLEYLRERHMDEVVVARHRAILNSIAAFDASKARFSLYKIKRAIEGRFSLREYIDCK